jgi:8-oxo-dGTP diphosphatase
MMIILREGGAIMGFPTHIVAIGGLITNGEGEILMVRSPRRGWEFPGGQVEIGEDLISALKREIMEEAGVEVEINQLAGVYSNTKTRVFDDNVTPVPTKVMFGFLGEMVSGELRTSEESIEVGWFKRDMVLEMMAEPMLKDRMRDMLEFNGTVIYRSYRTKPYEVYIERKI